MPTEAETEKTWLDAENVKGLCECSEDGKCRAALGKRNIGKGPL